MSPRPIIDNMYDDQVDEQPEKRKRKKKKKKRKKERNPDKEGLPDITRRRDEPDQSMNYQDDYSMEHALPKIEKDIEMEGGDSDEAYEG